MKYFIFDLDDTLLNNNKEVTDYTLKGINILKNNDFMIVINTARSLYFADLLSYVAICKYGLHTGMRNGVYKLNFQEYIDIQKQSWNNNGTDALNYINACITSSRYIVIYGLDNLKFKDFESQEFLKLLDKKSSIENKVYIISSHNLIGEGDFYRILQQRLKKEIANVNIN
jgi:hydroxymethylpyrimidine pyrophosphatase-like HAD family hydrolase